MIFGRDADYYQKTFKEVNIMSTAPKQCLNLIRKGLFSRALLSLKYNDFKRNFYREIIMPLVTEEHVLYGETCNLHNGKLLMPVIVIYY